MQRALITGLNGFTGHYLKEELEAHGWEVHGTGMADLPGHPFYYQQDLADVDGLQALVNELSPDVVAHLAAVSFVAHDNADEIYRTNLLGTRNLLVALAHAKQQPKAVLLASSANIYGNSAEGVLTESVTPNPANDYAVSKLAMEYMARLWQDRLQLIIVRPFNYTGVGQSESFLLPKIVAHFRNDADVIELGNIDVWRDFSDVRAVVRAYRRLIEVSPAGATVNVCSGITHSLREVLVMAEDITGHKLRIKVNPNFVRPNEIRSMCGDPGRLRSLIGSWETPPFKDTLRWMLEEREV